MMYIPKLSREEVIRRARSLCGTPASMPARRDTLDCLDLVFFAYDFQYPKKDIEKWGVMIAIIKQETGWRTREQGEIPQPADLATFWLKGPHVGIFIDDKQIIHAGSRVIKTGSWARLQKYSEGVLTWH